MRSVRIIAGFVALAAAMTGAGLSADSAAGLSKPARKYDFNGDGYRDLAAGAPGMRVNGLPGAGAVLIGYGSAKGLDTSRHQVISRAAPGVPGAPVRDEEFGADIASADFDGDGYADLALGVQHANPAYLVVYGSATGLSARATTLPGRERAIAASDLDRDGYADLVTGTSNFSCGAPHPPEQNQNTVTIWYGGPGGVPGTRATELVTDRGSPDRSTECLIDFATGDVDGDGRVDLAVSTGLPESTDARTRIYRNGPTGFSTSRQLTGSFFGGSIALGDTNGDRRADLVAGNGGWPMFGDDRPARGRIAVALGTATGLAPARLWTQDSAGIPGSMESYDYFGWSVAMGDINGDGRADAVIGSPGEGPGSVYGYGSVTALLGSATGLGRGRVYTQNTTGVPGAGERGDYFGVRVALVDLNADGRAELVSGACNENSTEPLSLMPECAGDGAVSVLRGTSTGLTGSGARTFGAATLGGSSTRALFGAALGR